MQRSWLLPGTAAVRLAIAGATVPQIAALYWPQSEGHPSDPGCALPRPGYSAPRSRRAEARSENKLANRDVDRGRLVLDTA